MCLGNVKLNIIHEKVNSTLVALKSLTNSQQRSDSFHAKNLYCLIINLEAQLSLLKPQNVGECVTLAQKTFKKKL